MLSFWVEVSFETEQHLGCPQNPQSNQLEANQRINPNCQVPDESLASQVLNPQSLNSKGEADY